MWKRMSALLTMVVALGIASFALLQFQGCGGGGGSGSSSTGTLQLAITDKQSDNFAQVVVSIREIRAVPAGRENAADNDPGLPIVAQFSIPRVIDVMQLQFVQQALGEALLPAGTYSQIRLILEPNPTGQGQTPVNYLVLKTDPATRIPLTTPSAQQSGLKILGPITVKQGQINAVMIDFDPNTAIVARGNGAYNLKPTGIRLVQLAAVLGQYGSITGNVTAFAPWSSATVAVKRRGTINDVDPIASGRIFSNYTSGTWQAPFAAFVPGSTSVSYKTFITANGFQVYSSPAVNVTAGAATDLGDIGLTTSP